MTELSQYSCQQFAWFEMCTIDERNIGRLRQLHRQVTHNGCLTGAFGPAQKSDTVQISQGRLQKRNRIVIRSLLDGGQQLCVLPKRLLALRGVIRVHSPTLEWSQ